MVCPMFLERVLLEVTMRRTYVLFIIVTNILAGEDAYLENAYF